MKRTLPIALTVLSLVLLTVLTAPAVLVQAGGAADDAKAAAPYKMVAELEVVMDHMDDLFYGIEDKVKAKKLKSVRRDAMVIAELSNVSRYAEDFGKKKGWAEYTKTLIQQMTELTAAAKKKDVAKVNELFKAAEATCETCHEEIRDAEDN